MTIILKDMIIEDAFVFEMLELLLGMQYYIGDRQVLI